MSIAVVPVIPGVSSLDDPAVITAIKQTVAKGASDAQLMMFLQVCKRTGLDPFLKEVWFVAQTGVIMAGRDGYLRVANEHPQFDGMETRVERDERGIPIKAVCTVWRKDRNHPTICEAYFNEYAKESTVWKQYKSAMIGKVAEVLALKRSFAINGTVTEEEIGNGEPARTWADGAAAAKEVSEQKLLAMRNGAEYRDVSSRDSRLDAEPETKPEPVAPPEPKPPFSMSKSIGEFEKIKKFACESLGDEPGKALYYRVLGAHGVEHANQLKSAKPARDCYRMLAAEIDAAISYLKSDADEFDKHMAATE